MNAAVQHQLSPARPRTLGEFNALLDTSGLSRVSPAEMEALRKRHRADDLARAAMQARTNPNARAYLEKALAGVRVWAEPATAPPEPPPMAPPPEPWPGRGHERGLDPRDENPGSTGTVTARGERLSVHVYGSGAALCFEPDATRRGEHTIALDAARSTGPRAYDWGGKIRLQVTQAELPVVAGVLLGRIAKCEYGNHGPENDKGFSLENQDGKIFARVFAKGKSPCAVPIGPEDAYRVTALVVRQLRENAPWLEAGDVIRLVAEVVARLKK